MPPSTVLDCRGLSMVPIVLRIKQMLASPPKDVHLIMVLVDGECDRAWLDRSLQMQVPETRFTTEEGRS